MKKVLPKAWRARFDAAAEISPKSGVMFWHARDLMDLLGYSPRAVLKPVVDRAIVACDEAGRDTEAHFLAVTRTVADKGTKTKEVADYRLSRFGALLMAQTGDVSLDEVAYARLYFSEPAPAPKPVAPAKKPAPAAVAKTPAATQASATKPAKKTAARKTTAKTAVPVAPVKSGKAAKAVTPAKTTKGAKTTKSAKAAAPAKSEKPAKTTKAKPAKKAPAKSAPNSWQAALARKQGAAASTASSEFIPGKQVEHVNQALNPRQNLNLAMGRGYPNGAARNAR